MERKLLVADFQSLQSLCAKDKADDKCLNKQRLEAVEMFEADARGARAALGRCGYRRAARANAGEESPIGDLHEAPPFIYVLAAWRAKFRHSK